MRALTAAGISILLVLAACSPTSDEGESSTTPPTTGTTLAPTTTQPLVAGCVGENGFVEDGEIADIDQGRSDSTTISSISWQETESCETFTFSFVSSEGAPATTPPSVAAGYVAGVPIVRVGLDVEATVITDQLVETELVDRLFVVRSLDGGMFVDLYLTAPAQAHVSVTDSPARVTLQLQPGIVEYRTEPAMSDLVVIASPLDGAVVPTTVDVFGYSRTFESNVLLIATVGDEVVAEQFTTSADSIDTWGEFRSTLVLPLGEVSVFVGDENPEDGRLEGIAIQLTVQE